MNAEHRTPQPPYTAIEARPLQSLPLSSTKPYENGSEREEMKREKEHRRRSKNWTRTETLKLIRYRSVMDSRFCRTVRKSELWEEISEALVSEGVYRDSQQCRDKWEKLTAGFKEVLDGVREKDDYPYYDELEPVLLNKGRKSETHSHRIETLMRSDDEDSEDSSEFPARKRRNSGEESVEALKEIVESLMEKQQRFFSNLLESMERRERMREKLRVEREEKWREEERAQRVTFQNAMILLTKKLVNESGSCYRAPGEVSIYSPEKEISATTASGGGGVKKRSKNWRRAEVERLIRVRGGMEGRFVKATRRGALWEEVAGLMCAEGVNRDAKQCKEKWDKLMAEYKEVSEGKRDRSDSPYFEELVAVARGGGESSSLEGTPY